MKEITATGTLFFLCIVLSGCGGGSGSATEIRGVAARGAPLADSRVEIRGQTGSASTTTGADGSYAVDVSALTGPFLIRVCDGAYASSACAGAWYYSFADTAAGRANIHPLSDLVLRAWYRVHTGVTVDAAFGDGSQPLPSSAEIRAIGQSTSNLIRSLYPSSAVLDDLLTTAFSADGTGFDATLDSLGADFVKNVESTIEFVAANPGVFTHFMLRAGVRTSIVDGGAPAIDDVLHSEIFAPAGSLTSAALSCSSGAGSLSVPLSMIPAAQSAIPGSDDFYVPQDSVPSAITGSCDLAITKSASNAPVTFHAIPVLSYSGRVQLEASQYPLKTGVPVTVSWTLPAGLKAQYLTLVGWVNDSGGGFRQPEAIHPSATAASATMTLPSPSNGAAATNMGIALYVNGASAELSIGQVQSNLLGP